MQYFSSKHKLGILGGGQLGKMLLYNTRKFDIHTSVLDPNKDAPSRISCDSFYQGDLMDYNTVYDFGKKVDTLTIEIENVNVKALKDLEIAGVRVYPSSKSLEIIRNKARQKDFYEENGLPTADFETYENRLQLEKAIVSGSLFVGLSAKRPAQGHKCGNLWARQKRDVQITFTKPCPS